MTDYRKLEHDCGVQLLPKRDMVAVRGEGVFLYDENGVEYLDCVAGISVANLGHSHPRLVQAVQQQAATLITCPNILFNDRRSELLRKLVEITPAGLNRAFLCNSGAESIEAALKFARLHTGRSNFIATKGGFHGRTMGAVSATYTPKYRDAFQPLIPGFNFLPFNDIAALDATIDEHTAAVIFELVQGEGGVNPARTEYVAAARKLCNERGALLIIDEIQTGFGRTGRLFACEHFDLQPDILCLAKALGGGVPIGATLLRDDIKIDLGMHGTTFGGNPLASAAALEVISVYEDESLTDHARALGDYFEQQLRADELSQVVAVRRLGLMIGIELQQESQPKLAELLERQIIALPAGPNVIRLLPPLIINKAQIDRLVAALREILV